MVKILTLHDSEMDIKSEVYANARTMSVCLSVALLKAFALKILRLVFGAIIGWMNWVLAGLNTKCELNADHVTSLMCI